MFVRTPWPVRLGWPYMAWLIVHWVRQVYGQMWSVWLVFCYCGFHLSVLWWIRIRGLWKLPHGRDWLKGTAGHCWPLPLLERLKHSSGSISVWSLCPGAHKVCLSPPRSLAGMRFDSKHDFAPPTLLLGLLFCPWMWGIFFWWDTAFSCWQCSAASCNFRVLTGEDEHMSFYFTILKTCRLIIPRGNIFHWYCFMGACWLILGTENANFPLSCVAKGII